MQNGIGNYVRVVEGLGACPGVVPVSGLGRLGDYDPDRGPDDPVYTYKVSALDKFGLTGITWEFGQLPASALKLYFVNRTLIGSDPNNVKVGAVLTLPAGWPAQKTRKLPATAAWANEAAAALKNAGFLPVPQPPKPPAPPAPPPAAPPAPPSRQFSKAGGDYLTYALAAGLLVTVLFRKSIFG